MRIYTIGHSTRSFDELTEILRNYKISQLADVRSVPKSRHTPQFNEAHLAAELPRIGIDYIHLAGLGGLRHASKDSINTGWRNVSFRGYADYMQTPEFIAGVEDLLQLAAHKTTAIMCAEAVPWRCHRSLIGDALLVRDIDVIDIFDVHKSEAEKITSFARIDGQSITYPGESQNV